MAVRARERRQRGQVRIVQCVQDRFGTLIIRKLSEIPDDVLDPRAVCDHVEPSVRAAAFKHFLVYVARHRKVQLHDDAVLFIQLRKFDEKIPEQLLPLCRGKLSAAKEQPLRLGARGVTGREFLKTVVAYPATVCHKVLQPFLRRVQKVGERCYFISCDLAQPFEVRPVQRQQLIRAERRRNDRATVPPVRGQIVAGVVRRRDVFHFVLLQQRPHRDVFQPFVRLFADPLRAVLVQRLAYPEHLPKFQMRPIVQRIPRQLRHDLCVFQKFIMVTCVARDVLLVHPAQAHGAPFVMVPRKPQLPDVRKLRVRFYLVPVQVAVVVDDGQVLDLPVYLLRASAV